jgi:hypothetical protein
MIRIRESNITKEGLIVFILVQQDPSLGEKGGK